MDVGGSDILSAGYDRVARALGGRRRQILSAWERAVRRVVADADEFTVAQLMDSMPTVLDDICSALTARHPGITNELAERTRGHGANRFQQRYAIHELLVEYRLLRQIVIEQVHAVLAGSMSGAELTAVNLAVDAVTEGGTVAFVEAQRQHIERGAEVESKFLAYLAHDQRNNLNHAVLLLEVHTAELADYPALADSRADLAQVRAAIFATTEGMERLMEAERLRRAAVDTCRESVDLVVLLGGIAHGYAAAVAERKLFIGVDVPPGSTIQSDPALIRLAVSNLVGNAVKFSTRGAISIVARPAPVGRDTGWLVTVADEGPGIAADQIERLFDAFARGETHGQAGMGLGLSIASQAARLLGGGLTVKSHPGAGSVFTLALPNGPTDILPPM